MLPETVDAAVDVLLVSMRTKDKDALTVLCEEDIQKQSPLCLWIRRKFDLQDNRALRYNTGKRHPDEAAFVILEAAWKRLRGT